MSSTGWPANETSSGAKTQVPTHRPILMNVLMLGTTFCWASNIVAGKEALRGFGPVALAQIRLAGAALVLAILFLFWRRRPRLRLRARQWLFFAWVAFTGITLNQLCFISGLSRSSAVHTGLIVALGPVLVLVLACVMRLEDMTTLKFSGMIISFAGVGVLTLGKAAQGSGATLSGDLFLLGGSALFAYYTVVTKKIVEQYDSLTFNTILFVMGAFLMVPFSGRALLKVRWISLPPQAWWGAGFMIIFGSVAAYLIYAFALTELTAARAAAFSYLQPVIAAGLGVWLLGESLTLRLILSGALILLGVYLTERERGEEKQVQNQPHVVA